MVLSDVKRCLLKNVSIVKSKDILLDGLETFETKWDPFYC